MFLSASAYVLRQRHTQRMFSARPGPSDSWVALVRTPVTVRSDVSGPSPASAGASLAASALAAAAWPLVLSASGSPAAPAALPSF